ncbi:MAG: radical SAM protein, partial [Acidobacteriaceae bacterium]
CVHCYLDHDGKGEMSTAEVKDVIRQLSECGTFFLSISGGEPLLRRDCFEILEYARGLRMNVKLKTNAVMIGAKEAARIKELGIEMVQISLYSHLAETHDAITKLPGSWKRTIAAIGRLKANDVKVTLTNVLMTHNSGQSKAVKRLAEELGVGFVVDPTITPKLNGDRSILRLGVSREELEEIFHNEEFVGDVAEYCAPPASVDEDVLEGFSCSAGHTLAYISPFAEVFPCVQFPMSCGTLRKQSFSDIWWNSPALGAVRSTHVRDLHTCSKCTHVASCSRCPGLAYMEGDFRGPSPQDCEKSYIRTGIPSAGQLAAKARVAAVAGGLVQIAGVLTAAV